MNAMPNSRVKLLVAAAVIAGVVVLGQLVDLRGALTQSLDRIDGMGHTSGWDMLAGATMGLAAAAAARNTPST